MRRCLALLLSSLCCLSAACSAFRVAVHAAPPSEEVRRSVERVGVRPDLQAAVARLEAPTKGPWEGAGKGAWQGAVLGLEFAAEMSRGIGDAGILAGGIALLTIAAIPVTTLVGSIVGCIRAPGSETVELASAVFAGALSGRNLSSELCDHVVRAIEERTSLRPVVPEAESDGAPAADASLEVRVEELRFLGEGIDPPIALSVRCRVLWTDPEGELVHEVERTFAWNELRFTRWAEQEARPLLRELELAWPLLAAELVDELFLVHLPAWGATKRSTER